MQVVIAGGSGFIGVHLARSLAATGHQVVILSRSGGVPPGGAAERVRWDPGDVTGPWASAVAGADAVVNLAGTSIANGRWTPARKALLRSSRLAATNALVRAIERAPQGRRPRVLVSASAIGFYGDRGAEVLTERSQPGADFLAALCQEWEGAARGAERLGVRVALLRTGIVLDRDGGALPRMLLPFRLLAGGPLGSGTQWTSWIHVDDEVGILRHAIEQDSASGPLNATAPNPVTMRDMAASIGRALGRPSWLPAPAFALKLALGEMAGPLLLASQRVLPEATLASGYTFRFTGLDGALRDLLGGSRASPAA
ncbi:MAG: TIGR01777 family protein [Chloroflexi bacterium]|nr:TIGR01777 family protein [Chloroflexota bacterium]